MNENDKRVKKTKVFLQKALAETLLEKPIEKITISELTNKVGISRGAFYSHYDDIYALYHEMEEVFFNKFDMLGDVSPNHDYKASLLELLTFIQENAAITKCFSLENNDSELRFKLTSFFEARLTDIVLYSMNSVKLHENWKYMIHYHASGIVSLFFLWIDSNFSIPKEQVLEIIAEIDERCDSMY